MEPPSVPLSASPCSSWLSALRRWYRTWLRGETTLDNRLKALRAELGWSQQLLAQKLEVSRQSVNAIETGRYDPSLPLAFKIARVFGRTIEEIFIDDAKDG